MSSSKHFTLTKDGEETLRKLKALGSGGSDEEILGKALKFYKYLQENVYDKDKKLCVLSADEKKIESIIEK